MSALHHLDRLQKYGLIRTDPETSMVVLYAGLILSSWVLQKLERYAAFVFFFRTERSVRKAVGECVFSSASSGCFQLPSNRRKYLLLKTERIIFLPWLASSGIWLVLDALLWGTVRVRRQSLSNVYWITSQAQDVPPNRIKDPCLL